MLEHSFQDKNTAKKIEIAVESVLEKGYRTKDIYEDGKKEVSTTDMGALVSEEFKSISKKS